MQLSSLQQDLAADAQDLDEHMVSRAHVLLAAADIIEVGPSL